MDPLILEPEFVVDFDGLIKAGPIVIKDGLISSIGEPTHTPGSRLRLANHAILPGFVNAHSHAFQRALRGLVEQKIEGVDNFFNWRQHMYQLVASINPEDMGLITRLAYLEMLEAGFTHVGEFHYLHHDVQGLPYKDPLSMSRAITKAAQDIGINLCLLMCAYNRSDFTEALNPAQKRFGFDHVDDYIGFTRSAISELSSQTTSIGAALHSVRAVPSDWYPAINDFVTTNLLPLHVHVSEQEQDVTSCLHHTGQSPVGLLNKFHLVAPHTTLIHATHLINDDLTIIKQKKPCVCICPSTEKNLGDGMAKLLDLYEHNQNICLGTDQHVRIDPFGEARSLEEQERLRLQRRTILGQKNAFLHQTLLPSLTKYGMRSLYPTHQASLINQPANLIAVELPPEYAWHGPIRALEAIMLAHSGAHVTHVITNGHLVITEKYAQYREKEYLIKQIKRIFKK